MAAITAPASAMGAAGSALAGPAADALKKLTEVLKDVGRAVEVSLLQPLKLVADALKTAVAPPLKLVADGLKAVGEAAKWLAGQWSEVSTAVFAVGTVAAGVGAMLAGAAAPALALFALSLSAVAARIGSEFLPQLSAAGKTLLDVGAGVGWLAGQFAGKLLSALGAVASLAVGAASAILEFGQQIKEFVAKANPAAVARFDQAMNDMMAVIGQALLPVFNLATEVVRMFADTIATFVGPMGDAIGTTLRPLVGILGTVFEVFGRIGQAVGDAMQAVAPAFAGIADVVGALLEAIRPLFDLLVNVVGGALSGALKVLGGLLEMVIPPVLAFARAIGDVIKWVVDGVRSLLSMIGIDLPDKPGTEKGKSVGAATQSASTTDIDSVLRKARENAFSLGTGATDPASKTASATASMKARADEIHKWLTTELPNILKSLPAELAKAIGNATGEAAMSAIDTVADPLLGSRAERSARADEVLGAVRPGATGPVAGVLDIFERMRGRHADGSGTVGAG